jgi:phosphoketolase
LRTPAAWALTAPRHGSFAPDHVPAFLPMSLPPPPEFPTDDFRHGLRYLGSDPAGLPAAWTATPALAEGSTALAAPVSDTAAWQTVLAADALRYLTLQVAATKASGHPGGFCSSAEAVAGLFLLGHKTLFTEVGHHAPGYYSALFLDGSLAAMGIRNVADFARRFREQHGLLGHLSGAIPGVPAPAGPLGQGQHFAWAAARLHPGRLCPVTIGDGGMGEPYVMSAFKHYHVAYPAVTNVLPLLVWNGFSQEHHSMVSTLSDAQMVAYWRAHEFDEVVLVDAATFNDSAQTDPFVDSTLFSPMRRVAFARAVLEGLQHAADLALRQRRRTVFILKQLKGAGSHGRGAKAHHLYPQFTLDHPDMVAGLQRRALSAHAWSLVATNFRRAAGGPAAQVALSEPVRPLPPLPELPLADHPVGEAQIPASALSPLVAAVGAADPDFIVTSADGNEASGVRGINDALKIRHPTEDPLYSQSPDGRVFEPISEDACAGLAAATALLGARSLWFSYESFAVNGLPFFQTVTQAMAELRRPTPSTIAMFTAGALEQGRNGWTHQRPEIEAYFMALARNGNVHPLFPLDANSMQAAYAWAVTTCNQGIALFGCKTAIPVRLTLAQSRQALDRGAITLHETAPRPGAQLIVLAVCGDLAVGTTFETATLLEAAGHRVRVVAVVAPRRLYRPCDVATHQITLPEVRDDGFLDNASFDDLFNGDALFGVAAGASATLEPVLVRSRTVRRDVAAWRRGDTTAGTGPLLAFNDLDASALAHRAAALLD